MTTKNPQLGNGNTSEKTSEEEKVVKKTSGKTTTGTPKAESLTKTSSECIEEVINKGEVTEQGVSYEKIKDIMGENFFGPEEWANIFPELSISDTPLLPSKIEQIVNEDDPFESGEKVADTHVLFLLPKQAGREDITIMRWKKGLISNNNSSHPDGKFWAIDYNEKANWFDNESFANTSSKTEWVLMLKSTLPNTESKNYDEQDGELAKYPNYTTGKINEVTTGTILHYLNTGESLFTKESGWCKDIISHGHHVYISNLSDNLRPLLLHINSHDPDYLTSNRQKCELGRAVIRKLS